MINKYALAFATLVFLPPVAYGADPTHCRETTVKRKILKTSVADIKTIAGREYEIVLPLVQGSTFSISIDQNDGFKLEELKDGRIWLRHFHERDPYTRQPKFIASAKLALDSQGLWFRGSAFLTDGSEVGEYFVYQLPSAGTAGGHSKCRQNGSATPCKTVHFEYFDNLDSANFAHKPLIGTNVVELAGKPSDYCLNGELQTGEGDGDEGPED